MQTFAPRFGVFNVEQVEYRHAEQQAALLSALKVKKVYVSDSDHFHWRGERLQIAGLEFEATYSAKRQCLYVHLAQLSDNKCFADGSLPMRVLAFLKPEETIIVTDKVTIK